MGAADACELGAGTAAVAAAAAGRAAGALVVAVVTEPFGFEGGDCTEIAQTALSELQAVVDVVVVVQNNRLQQMLPEGTPEAQLTLASDDVLRQAIAAIATIATLLPWPYYIVLPVAILPLATLTYYV